MNKGRQFAVALLISSSAVLSGCQARSTPDAVQTAIGMAQAAATVLPDTQGLLPALQSLLGGATLDVTTAPDGAGKEWVTDVNIKGTDRTGTLAQLDARARQAAATAALLSAAQYYPNATIVLTITDGSGGTLLTGRKAADSAPEVQ